jgi:phasin family protein
MAMQNPYADMMKLWGEYKTPQMASFDVNEALTFGRKNAAAVSAAGQTLAEGAQTIARRQAELTRSQVESVLKTTKDMLVNGSPEINTGKQVELAKRVFETSLNNLREVTELVTKSGFEMFDVLNKRATASIEELTSLGKRGAAKGAAKATKKTSN